MGLGDSIVFLIFPGGGRGGQPISDFSEKGGGGSGKSNFSAQWGSLSDNKYSLLANRVNTHTVIQYTLFKVKFVDAMT